MYGQLSCAGPRPQLHILALTEMDNIRSRTAEISLSSPILSWSDMVRWTRKDYGLDVVCEEREEISSSSAGPCGGQTVGDTETALTVQSVLGRQGGHSQAPVTQ